MIIFQNSTVHPKNPTTRQNAFYINVFFDLLCSVNNTKMQNKKLSFWQMWNLSFGFFGVQIAYALQSANISRIFATLGADPHQLSFFS